MKVQVNHIWNRSRSGLSLLEIMAAMFVLMVGLLGVLAVLPFGMYQMNRVNHADFGGNCGRAAIQEIQVRNWAGNFADSLYDPYAANRVVFNPMPGNAQNNLSQPGVIFNSSNKELRCDRPMIVDPLLIFSNNMAPDDGLKYFGLLASWTNGLPRITCQLPPPPPNWSKTPMEWWQTQVFDAFYWKDDRNFAAPATPIAQVPRPVGVIGSDNKIQSHENYSWFYMLTPQVRGKLTNSYALEENIVGYDVDVVVFYNRNLNSTAPGDTGVSMSATRDGTGYRGGSFTLFSLDAEALDLTDTRWLLVSCPISDGTLYAKWYRIVNFGEIEPPSSASSSTQYTRRLMLLGPDVPDSSVPPGTVPYAVTLVKGAIHVYSATIKK